MKSLNLNIAFQMIVKNSAIRKEDLETGYSGFRSARRRREAGSNPDETPTQPASTQPASGEYAGTEIKAYYDNNHNGVFDEGDELISSTVIPPAPKERMVMMVKMLQEELNY